MIGKRYEPLKEWQKVCSDSVELSGRAVEGCGHYIAEEKPEELMLEIKKFFSPA